MSFHRSRYLKQTYLFLVRVWAKADGGDDGNDKGAGNAEWHGRVQRVIDGEMHEFDSLQGLLDVLQKMLSGATEGRS